MCGEKIDGPQVWYTPMGSPQRVRGKEKPVLPVSAQQGITPACAGKSRQRHLLRPDARDHPRVCGERSARPEKSASKVGSPPRVRGKVEAPTAKAACARITPACAGKSETPRPSRYQLRDHPRVCGEKRVQRGDVDQCSGSPPRVRGKAHHIILVLLVCRITPACAGKRSSTRNLTGCLKDHPRVCGEKVYAKRRGGR